MSLLAKQSMYWVSTMPSLRPKFLLNFVVVCLFSGSVFVNSAEAQVILIPGGGYNNGFERIFVVAISLALLWCAVRYSYRSGQLDFALGWFTKRFRKMLRR